MVNAVNASVTLLAQIGTEADTAGTTAAFTLANFNSITPSLTGVTAGNVAAYNAYIDANAGLFSAPATQAEVQTMITAVNTSQSVLAQIGTEGDSANVVASVVTVAQINSISPAIIGAILANQAAYRAYIDANPNLFDAPATVAQVQAMVNAVNVPTNPAGAGSLSGKTCFDVALGNDNTNSCGPLSARTSSQANFTQAATHTQSYTFTPSGTVSNVRFVYLNTNGTAVTAISGNNTGNNISTAVVATVNYVTSNTSFQGLTNTNPATSDIYVVYNDGATNNGTDRQLKLTAKIKDCACCTAKISASVSKEFLCHNLGANTSLDPHDMAQTNAWGLNGAYVQWGRRGPNTTGQSTVDWQTASNTINFAAAPTGSTAVTANDAVIAGWDPTNAANNAWRTAGGAKTAADPCPSGYRVPTQAEWAGVDANNTRTRSLPWTLSNTNYNAAVHYGPDASTKLLTLPVAGYRLTTGALTRRGNGAYYWSSTENTTNAFVIGFDVTAVYTSLDFTRNLGASIRCIAE